MTESTPREFEASNSAPQTECLETVSPSSRIPIADEAMSKKKRGWTFWARLRYVPQLMKMNLLPERRKVSGFFAERSDTPVLAIEKHLSDHFPKFPTLGQFRSEPEAFPLSQVTMEYNSNPIDYTVGLYLLATDLEAILLDSTETSRTLHNEYVEERELVAHGALSKTSGRRFLTKMRLILRFLRRAPVKTHDDEVWRWRTQWSNFTDNVLKTCKYVGSSVHELDHPLVTIEKLREHSVNNRNMAPLIQEFYKQHLEIEQLKKMNAVLQTRHIIEKLVAHLPNSAYYKRAQGAGRKWETLWVDTWKAAREGQDNTALSSVYNRARGRTYDVKNREKKGRELFSDMSEAIHDYRGLDMDCKYFQSSTRDIMLALQPLATNIDAETGEVAWAEEIKRYKTSAVNENAMKSDHLIMVPT